MKFDCPIQEGSVKIYVNCSACNKVDPSRNLWAKFNFDNNNFTGIDHEDIIIHNDVHLSRFVPIERISYDAENYILSYRLDSSSMRFVGYEESTLICPGPYPTPKPTFTPLPSATSINHDSTSLTNRNDGNNNEMIFDCPIMYGTIKINVLCSACNKISADQNVWFSVTFNDGSITSVNHQDITIHDSIKMDRFVPSEKVVYHPDNYSLMYYIDSANMHYNEIAESTLKCLGPRSTPTPSLPAEVSSDSTTYNIVEMEPTGRHAFDEDINTDRLVQVNVRESAFNSITSYSDGGAIHIVNGAIECNTASFNDCGSDKAGGAVYIKNEFATPSQCVFQSIDFMRDEARCGGAAYIYSSSTTNKVQFISCTFDSNKAKGTSSSGKLYGGLSLYLCCKSLKLSKLTFHNDTGEGATLKIVNDFSDSSSASALSSLIKADVVLIDDCKFEINKNSRSCIYFVRGNSASAYELRNCVFSGYLAKGAHFIDGETLSNKSPKLLVKSCRFASDYVNALNLNADFMSVNLKDQIFDVNNPEVEEKKETKTLWKIIVAVVVPALVIVAIVAIIFVMKKEKESSDENEHEMSSVMKSNLLDDLQTENNLMA